MPLTHESVGTLPQAASAPETSPLGQTLKLSIYVAVGTNFRRASEDSLSQNILRVLHRQCYGNRNSFRHTSLTHSLTHTINQLKRLSGDAPPRRHNQSMSHFCKPWWGQCINNAIRQWPKLFVLDDRTCILCTLGWGPPGFPPFVMIQGEPETKQSNIFWMFSRMLP